MNFLTALNLSFNNIITKWGRTLITAFASSIGIIGIALILSLSNGFDIQIDEFEASFAQSVNIEQINIFVNIVAGSDRCGWDGAGGSGKPCRLEKVSSVHIDIYPKNCLNLENFAKISQ